MGPFTLPKACGSTPKQMADIAGQLPRLTEGEQDTLVRQWIEKKDQEALSRLFFDKVALILHAVKLTQDKFSKNDGSDWDTDDLIGVGYLAFINAVNDYGRDRFLSPKPDAHDCGEPVEQANLNTYIVNGIGWDIYRNVFLVFPSIPFKDLDKLIRYSRELEIAQQDGPISPEKQDYLLAQAKISPSTIYGNRPLRPLLKISFDETRENQNPTSDTDPMVQRKGLPLLERYEHNLAKDRPYDPEQMPLDSEADRFLLRAAFVRAMATLTPRERQVLELRYALTVPEPMTLKSIGRDILGISQERVRQIEEKALRKLRTNAITHKKLADLTKVNISFHAGNPASDSFIFLLEYEI